MGKSENMKVEIENRQYKRLSVLIELYKESGASTFKAFDLRELANAIGIKFGNYEDIADYLKNEGLIKSFRKEIYFITHQGIKFVEANYHE